MSRFIYSENEELNFEDSLNKFEYIFESLKSKPPTLEEALIELFRNAGLSSKDSKELYDHLYLICNKKITDNWELIKKENEKISKNDAIIISSYTYEPKTMYQKYSPYRLLNTNLVSNNRKNGVINADKYLFLFLSTLRGLKKCKKDNLFRCISCKVKLEKDPNNDKFVPYEIGNQKVFWSFTSTSDDESLTENFLNDGKGTKYIIKGDDLWGYDISLFNVYGEKEIILEPERKYIVEKVKEGKVTEVVCKVIDNSQILQICNFTSKKSVSKYKILFVSAQ